MNTIHIRGFSTPSVSITGAAIDDRDNVIAKAREIDVVESDADATAAELTLRALAGQSKACEESRKAIKAPVLDLGRDIDAVAASYVAPIASETSRLTKLVAAYRVRVRAAFEQAERERAAEAARAARAAEEARLAIERAKAQELARIEAERVKREREAAEAAKRALDAATSVSQEFAAAEERERREREAKAAADEASRTARITAIDALQQVETQAVVTAAPAATPSWLSKPPKYKAEVVDVLALYRHDPTMVNLVPIMARVNEATKHGRHIPGVKLTLVEEVRVRA